MDRADPATDALIASTERWFLKRGTPHLIEGYDAREDVFTRVLPVLILVFLLEITGATSLDWTWWQNLLAVIAGAVLVAAIWAGVNRLRGRRPFQQPDDVGVWEIGLFLLVPPLLPVVFGGQLGAAAVTFAVNLSILAAVYLVASYGLVPMTRWALGRTLQQLSAVLGLFGRSMPLLLLFSVALFINGDVWAIAGSLDTVMLAVTCGFFVLVGLAFLLVRLPGEVRAIDADLTDEALVEACEATPLQAAAVEVVGAGDVVAKPLGRRQQGNLLLVLLFSQAVQVLLVTVATTAFFFVFGLIAIRPEVVAGWLPATDPVGVGAAGFDVHARWTWFGREMVISRALVQVSILLGTMSGFYFTVYVITDATYRREFFTEIVGEVRQSLGVRLVYLSVLARRAVPARR